MALTTFAAMHLAKGLHRLGNVRLAHADAGIGEGAPEVRFDFPDLVSAPLLVLTVRADSIPSLDPRGIMPAGVPQQDKFPLLFWIIINVNMDTTVRLINEAINNTNLQKESLIRPLT